jgi:RNA polymerase sigma-70 factor (ECF subfamily)
VPGDAFERLYEEHARPLLAFLIYRTGDAVLAEDLLADTFERALRARWRFDRRRASEKTWLYSIALNCLRDQSRRRRAEGRALAQVHALSASDYTGADQGLSDRDVLVRAMRRLTREQRDVVALRYGAGLTAREIARATGEPLSTIQGRTAKALRKLRDELL